MAVTPMDALEDLTEDQARRLVALFSDAERAILDKLTTALAKGNNTDHLRQQEAEIRAILNTLGVDASQWVAETVPDIYAKGLAVADAELARWGVGTLEMAWNGPIHVEATRILADAMHDRLTGAVTTVGRTTNDIFRALALENMKATVIGYDTWQAVARTYRQQLQARGITGFIDRANKRWNLSTYTQMVSRTTTREVALNAQANRLLEHGVDLVVVDSSVGRLGKRILIGYTQGGRAKRSQERYESPCDLCRPWEGATLSLTGATPGYPTLDEARTAGLFHPNCTHVYSMAIDPEDQVAKKAEPPAPDKADAFGQIDGLKTTKDMEAWGHERFGVRMDFTQVKPDVARAVLRGMQQFEDLFPGAMDYGLTYCGSYKGEIGRQVSAAFGRKRMFQGEWAHCRYFQQGYFGNNSSMITLGLGPSFNNPAKLLAELTQGVISGWHPVGCDTMESIVRHELAHFLDELMGRGTRVTTLIQRWKDDTASKVLTGMAPRDQAKVVGELSRYAMANRKERWAEAFASATSDLADGELNPLALEVRQMLPTLAEHVANRLKNGGLK